MSNNNHSAPLWHRMDAEQTAKALEVDVTTGLTGLEADARLKQYGPNELVEQQHRSQWQMFLTQFSDLMILILIAAALISGIIGEWQDSIAILVIVCLNAVIGFVQEYRAERAMAALKRLSAPSARTRRKGQINSLKAGQLVPGDIILLEAGDMIPADLRLLHTARLQLDESALTGESQPIEKTSQILDQPNPPLGDQNNMAFKGTLVTNGRGLGVVVRTGMDTELGRIATLLSKDGISKTPLQKRLARFGKRLAIAILAICALIFVTGLLRDESPIIMFLTAISLAVAAIPEALPAVVTISLALGARNMVRQHALIRRLPAVETLGSVTYICSDKTGTLTQNKMSARGFFVDGKMDQSLVHSSAPGSPMDLLGQAMALNNDANQDGEQNILGDPTEVALFLAAQQAGFERQTLIEHLPRQAEIPFDSERKCMTTLHQAKEDCIAFTKGAPEHLLPNCNQVLTSTGPQPSDSSTLLTQAEQLAAEGYRVLGFAYRIWPKLPNSTDPAIIESDLCFLGLVALMDPPRPEAAQAVELCKTAGITPVMITGDHAATAFTIAKQLGIASSEEQIITGETLEQMPLAEFEQQVETLRIYARVSPEQKIKIIQALQDKGEFAAMTGDGVNDAPALKQADIGVAMGLKGTDVAREAADMVLLDDNFATIVKAVREGRRIYDNIRKFIKDTMSSNSGELWTLFLAPFMGLPIPLLPIHILWINLVTDGLPGLAFTAEPAERGIMRRPPRPPSESIFAHGMWQHIIWVGLFVGGITIAAQAWAISRGVEYWQTIAFTVLTISQLFHSLSVRSEHESLFTQGLSSNLYMLGAVLLTVALHLMVVYLPVFNPIFKTQPLPLYDLGICFALSSLVLVAVELEKWLIRRKMIYQPTT